MKSENRMLSTNFNVSDRPIEIITLQKLFNEYSKGNFTHVASELTGLEHTLEDNQFYWHLRAQTQKKLAQHNLAELYFLKCISLDPNNVNSLRDLVTFYTDLGSYEQALKHAIRYTKLNPISGSGFNLMGKILLKLAELEQAEKSFDQSLLLNPGDIEALNGKGKINFRLGYYKNAISYYQKVLNTDPNNIEAISNLATAYLSANMVDKAQALIWQIPDSRLHSMGKLSAAQFKFNRSLISLSAGNCIDGWQDFLDRFDAPDFTSKYRHYHKPRLTNPKEANCKKVLIWPEQGIGDHFTYFTLLEEFRKISQSQITILCDPRMTTLLNRSFPKVNFVNDTTEMVNSLDYDYHLPVGDIAPLLNFNKSMAHLANPYLVPEKKLTKLWSAKLSSHKLKIGLAWESGFKNYRREKNYTNLIDWEALIQNNKFQIVNLQYGVEKKLLSPRELNNMKMLLQPDFDLKNDFENLSALLSNLDLVVCPTSSIMSHASACGVPTLSYSLSIFDKALGNLNKKGFVEIPWLSNNSVFIHGSGGKSSTVDKIIKLINAL